MKIGNRMILALVLCCGTMLFAGNAKAQIGIGGWGGYGFSRIYYGANRPQLPYFSLYPPVYYSYVVPRPYGYSPFALPPGVTPAEAIDTAIVEPAEISNPFYTPNPADESKPDAAPSKVVRTRGIIENPYYISEEDAKRRLVSR